VFGIGIALVLCVEQKIRDLLFFGTYLYTFLICRQWKFYFNRRYG